MDKQVDKCKEGRKKEKQRGKGASEMKIIAEEWEERSLIERQ